MTQKGSSSSPVVEKIFAVQDEEALIIETVPSISGIAGTPQTPTASSFNFRNQILFRLEDSSSRVRQFEPVFSAYMEMCEELIRVQKRQRSGSIVVDQAGTFDVSSAQLEALRNELSEVYKKKSINDQALLDHKKELEESRRQLGHLNAQKTTLENEREKFMRRIAELEVQLARVTEEKTSIYDEWLALKTSNSKMTEKLLELEQDRVQLITRIRDLQQQQATALNEEVSRHSALQLRKIQEDIAAALASTDLDDAGGGSEEESGSRNGQFISIGDVLPERGFKFEANDGEVTDVVFLKDSMAASAGSDKKVILWTVQPGGRVQRIAALTGSNQTVTRLDVCMEDEKIVLGASNDSTVRGWNVENQRLMFTLSGHSDKVSVARFYSNQQAVSGSYDRMIKTWDIRNGRCLKSFFPGSTVLDLVVNRSIFISGHFDKKLRVWDGRTAEPAHIVELGGRVTGLHRTSDDNQLLALSRDDTLSLLDIRSLQPIHTYSAEQFRTAGDSARCVVSPSMTYCAAGSSDGGVFIWNLRTTRLEKVLHRNGHDNVAVLSLAWAPNGRGLWSCDRHKMICYWE